MLDKSIPFHTIIMKRPYGAAPTPVALPAGYRLRPYQSGDEVGWAEIEHAVLEFDSVEQALECHQNYIPHMEELKKRQWFAEAPDGTLAATATAWYCDSAHGRLPTVHALACRPEHQGKGLGRAVAVKMLEAFTTLDIGRDVWLDTQTWSYKAVGLYLSLGFIPMKTATYNETPNEYGEALPILERVMKPEAYAQFVDASK